MRLLNVQTLQLHDFPGVWSAPSFAILSHTWGEQECSYQDMHDPEVAQRHGYAKIKHCCEQAKKDGLQWTWVDTCCIDKSSSAELSEAINSMFDWYANSSVCYVYLFDVSLSKGDGELLTVEQLRESRWVSRGWTLQELIAPSTVRFFSNDWTECGNRKDLAPLLHQATNIDPRILQRSPGSEELVSLYSFSISTRMSWAAKRQTTRPEDKAYCLMGLFRVNMAMVYGEGGPKAFYRLQEEIMKYSIDQSIFAWSPATEDLSKTTSILADSPSAFYNGSRILSIAEPGTFEMTNLGLQISPRLFNSTSVLSASMARPGMQTALLNCVYTDDPTGQLAINIVPVKEPVFTRILQGPVIVPLKHLKVKKDPLQHPGPIIDRQWYQGMWRHNSYKVRVEHVDRQFLLLSSNIEKCFDYLAKKEIQNEMGIIYIAHITNRVRSADLGDIYCYFHLKQSHTPKSLRRFSLVCSTVCSTEICEEKIYTITTLPTLQETINVYVTELEAAGPNLLLCRIVLSCEPGDSSQLRIVDIPCQCGMGCKAWAGSARWNISCKGYGVDLNAKIWIETISSRTYNAIDIKLYASSPPQSPTPAPAPMLLPLQPRKNLLDMLLWR